MWLVVIIIEQTQKTHHHLVAFTSHKAECCVCELTKKQSEIMAGSSQQRKEEEEDPNKGLYAVDIRVFLVTITLAMAAAFVAGVVIAPPNATAARNIKGTSILSSPETPNVRDEFFQLSEDEKDEAQDVHLPAGQHLLVDIEGVEEAFLNSEARLSQAMVDTVQGAGLHMLSYHCHTLLPCTYALVLRVALLVSASHTLLFLQIQLVFPVSVFSWKATFHSILGRRKE